MQTSGGMRREIAKSYPRHCERSEAIHCHLARGKMDCFAPLAMTGEAEGAVSTSEGTGRNHTSGVMEPGPRAP
jgi:hypothetical protein